MWIYVDGYIWQVVNDYNIFIDDLNKNYFQWNFDAIYLHAAFDISKT